LSFEKADDVNSAYIVEKKGNDNVSKQMELIDQEVQVDSAAFRWLSKGSAA
jgi:hypothetical protein